MITIKVVINPITGEGYPLIHCLYSSLGIFMWVHGNFSGTWFLTNPIMVPSFKVSLFLFLFSVMRELPDPSCFLPCISSPLPTPLTPSPLHPWYKFTKEISFTPLSWGNPCMSQNLPWLLCFLELWTLGWLSFALWLISTYQWAYVMFVFLCLGYITQDIFF